MSVLKKRTYMAAADRRQQILDHALALFAERGYHKVSIADVCASVGIGRATLYQHFKDKRDLLVALAQRITTRVFEGFAQRKRVSIPQGYRPTPDEIVGFIQRRFRMLLSLVFEDAAVTCLVLRTARGVDGVVDELLRSVDAAMLQRVEEELQAALDAGAIRPIDVGFVARFFMGGVEKTLLSYIDDDRPLDFDAISREAALLEVFGLLARPEPAAPDAAGCAPKEI